ncbi:MAG: 1-(5-phosphoribosyl)-5-[(5-phosphoribosylamino)methylideneamino]imidazole-4-carboxamide isomerase [Chloroflexi bacterium]|nr:1-(5-phosphoribosyl)-5-[(5-phosphoribosylamino)methylideneamino]imidazole-4-carboxamide isomerase [Chloroflexota bacterium]
MEVIPAIDLRGGKCVRLYQGDYRQETVFSDDPVGVAVHWSSLGAPRLHVVDLDGAARGELCHLPVISAIVKAVEIPVQVGGGVRRVGTIAKLLGIGVRRVIIGTAAVENPDVTAEACRRFGDAIILGVDARDGCVAIHGWQTKTEIPAVEFVEQVRALGARRVIYTDILRDGTLTGPNFDGIARLTSSTKLPIIASGGITSVEDLARLSKLGVEGAIVGRTLYSGGLKLDEAVALFG